MTPTRSPVRSLPSWAARTTAAMSRGASGSEVESNGS